MHVFMILFRLGLLLWFFFNIGPLSTPLSLFLNGCQSQIGNQLANVATTTFVLHTCSLKPTT